MESKDVAGIFGTIFAGILVLTLSFVFLPLASTIGRLLAICLLAGGGILLSFMPLIMERKRRKQEG